MKKLLLIASMLMTTNVFAHELPNYQHVKGAVGHGAKIRVVTDFSKCSYSATGNSAKAGFMVGVYTPNEVIIKKDGDIAFSMNHFTLNDPTSPGKAVYQYVTYNVSADNMVTLRGAHVDAVTKVPLMDLGTYKCEMTKGAHVYMD